MWVLYVNPHPSRTSRASISIGHRLSLIEPDLLSELRSLRMIALMIREIFLGPVEDDVLTIALERGRFLVRPPLEFLSPATKLKLSGDPDRMA